MKKTFIGLLLVVGSTSAFAEVNTNCRAVIIKNYPSSSNASEQAVQAVLEKNGFTVVSDPGDAQVAVVSSIGSYSVHYQARAQTLEYIATLAITNLYAASMSESDYFFGSANSYNRESRLPGILVQGYHEKKGFQSRAKALEKSLEKFDMNLKKAGIRCVPKT